MDHFKVLGPMTIILNTILNPQTSSPDNSLETIVRRPTPSPDGQSTSVETLGNYYNYWFELVKSVL